MSFQDIAELIVEAKKNANAWLHLIQTSTNNISTEYHYQCALNGYLAGYAKANDKLQSECERLKAENEKAKEQGAREMAEIAARSILTGDGWSDAEKHCEVENFMELWREKK